MAQVDFENLLKQAMGLDSASVGKTSIERAVRLRMASVGAGHVEDYWEHLHGSTSELQELIEAVVVPETWFFRDPEAFSLLARLAIEEWRPAHPASVLRFLSIPCSTGEEPYSMIMALLDAGFSPEHFQVDALDISARALAQAERGVYGANSFRGRNLTFRERYFRSTADGYALPKWLCGKVNFQQGNLLSAGSRFKENSYDVIFCRNLLIYFDRPMREQAMRTLTSLLAPSAFLFVGPAETFLASCCGFTALNQAMSFAFRRTPSERVANASLPAPPKPVRRGFRPRRQAPVRLDSGPTPVRAPAPPLADLEKARSLADAGRLREAAELCESHLKQQGPSAEAYYLLGLVRDGSGDRQNAAECYRKAVYLAPGHAEALAHLALLSEAQGDIASAGRLRERARRAADGRSQ